MDNPLIEIAQGLSLLEGVVLGFSDDGLVLVQLRGSGDMVSCSAVSPNRDTPMQLDIDDRVLVALGSSDNATYYILGVLGVQAKTAASVVEEKKTEAAVTLPKKPMTAKVDGKRVKIEADEEIELVCGEGSIKIRKDGKIILRGTDLMSRASRTNKIRGAAVRIN